jgi:hypothetical protein
MKRLIAALALGTVAMSGQVVTATKLVDYEHHKELLRKINGRWWTQDNREVFPPGKGGVFWELDSKPGVVDFFHHTPFDLSKAESLHLFMTVDQVEAICGKPNRIFRMGPDGGEWMYYAANGTIVQVRIMDGVLGEAEYDPATGKSTPVASVAQDLGGRNIFELMAQRAGQKSASDQAKRVAAAKGQMPTQEDHARRIAELKAQTAGLRAGRPGATLSSRSNAVLNMRTTAEPEKHIVQPEALATIKVGAPKADVLAALGEPSAKYSIASGDGVKETLRYHREDGQPVEIKLVDGKVAIVP